MRESGEEAFARVRSGFDVRIVAHAERLARDSIVRHSVEYETVEAVAGPRVTDAERFKNEKRLGKCGAMLQRAIEREVGMKAASGDHPIQNVVGGRPGGRLVAVANADSGNGGQRDLY